MSAPGPALTPVVRPRSATPAPVCKAPSTSKTANRAAAGASFAEQEAARVPTSERAASGEGLPPVAERLSLIQAAFADPKRADTQDDVRDPKTTEANQATAMPLTETPSREPDALDPGLLAQLAQDAASEAHENVKDAVEQRLLAFIAASGFLAEAAKEINDKKDLTLEFVGKAFEIASVALVGLGLAKIAAAGLAGLVRSALTETFKGASKAVGTRIASSGDKVRLSELTGQQAQLIAEAQRAVSEQWKTPTLRANILAAQYPNVAARELGEATESIKFEAFRAQYASTMTAWLGGVRKAKGGDAGTLVMHVDFAPSGAYVVTSCDLLGMGDSTIRALVEPVLARTPGAGPEALTLGELLRGSMATAGLRVRIVDNSQAAFEWDARDNAITTPDSQLMHHHVNAWGVHRVGRIGPGVGSMVVAHRFLFEELGSRTLGSLGLHA